MIVNSRPKFSSGGWEVYIKCTGNQKWSKASNSKDKIGNLKETISFANKKMIELSQTQKEDCQGCDESTEQKPMKKKRRKSEVVDLSFSLLLRAAYYLNHMRVFVLACVCWHV